MVPSRDLGQYSSGGADNDDEYLRTIRRAASALARSSSSLIILEPDALAHTVEQEPSARDARVRLLHAAQAVLSEACGAALYVDIGHARWLPVERATAMLRSVNAIKFAINVSNYVSLDESLVYGEAIAAALAPDASFVVDVGRSGNGAASDGTWCNPMGRALGPPPRLERVGRCDATLWVKPPGESDGDAPEGAPPAGVYHQAAALELARARQQPTRPRRPMTHVA